jgi:hypothetical protein
VREERRGRERRSEREGLFPAYDLRLDLDLDLVWVAMLCYAMPWNGTEQGDRRVCLQDACCVYIQMSIYVSIENVMRSQKGAWRGMSQNVASFPDAGSMLHSSFVRAWRCMYACMWCCVVTRGLCINSFIRRLAGWLDTRPSKVHPTDCLSRDIFSSSSSVFRFV